MARIKPLLNLPFILSEQAKQNQTLSLSSSRIASFRFPRQPLDSLSGEWRHRAMRRRLRSQILLTFAAIALFATISLRNPSRHVGDEDGDELRSLLQHPNNLLSKPSEVTLSHIRRVSSVDEPGNRSPARTVSVLLADWEVLVIVEDDRSLHEIGGENNVCLFQNNSTSPAKFAGVFSGSNRAAFKCLMPNSVQRVRPFYMPTLTKIGDESTKTEIQKNEELYRSTFLVYESFSTENDVVLFVKGVNNRQGMSRSPSEFKCVFRGEESNAVKTTVTSSSQEVFRCETPDLTALDLGNGVRVSLEISSENNLVVPSVARYIPRRRIAREDPKSLICASAMVYNAGKFLKEWVTYNSKIGVEKFFLYDNDSNDNTTDVVSELKRKGFDITTTFWVWPKTQEAGFSHAAVHGSESCTWMMYVDVDEFVFSPSWTDSSEPSVDMLRSFLPSSPDRRIGQVSIRCNEFGPSHQRAHPTEGVTQGYTCRRSVEQRHKSIVLLAAVDPSLLNVVHHFRLRGSFRTKTPSLERGVVNHYKYQAWPEFRNKFRRRVSAYVADWTEKSNLASKDRTPGLGVKAVEPAGWDRKFCEVRDERLKMMTQRWFGSLTSDGYKMAWQ